MNKLVLLAIAGACGTLSRYWLSGLVYELAGRHFPWGTWAVNILGCFLFGLIWTLSEERSLISAQARTIVLVGFMGAFTTFSTLIFESSGQLRDAQWLTMTLNLAGQNVVGFVALALGGAIGRIL